MKFLQAILVLAGTALFFITEAHSGPDRREWTMRPADDSTHVQFGIEYRSNYSRWIHNSPVPWSQFKGISAEEVSKLSAPVKFEVRRDAGKLICEGTFHLGRGNGSYTFEANPKYKEELAKLGFHIAGNKQEIEYFMADLTLDFARAVKEANLRASSEELFEMRIHGLSKTYIADMRAAGYEDLTARDYIDMKIHGVDPAFVRDLKTAGYQLGAQKIVELRIHGVDSQFLADLKRAGYNLDADRIIELKNHGIGRDYIQQLASYGLKPDAEDLVQLKNHGVNPDYLRGLKEAGYPNLDAEQITQLKVHGVPASFIREARELGYNFTAKELTDMRIHGVDAAYLRRLKNSGFQSLTADKITQLKVHGVD